MGWYREIGEIVEALDEPSFPALLAERLRRLVACDLAAMFVYQGRTPPLLVFDNFKIRGAEQAVANYLNHTYVLNPVYQAHLKGVAPGVYRIRDLAPDAFFESEYHRQVEIILSDQEEIGYITPEWPRGQEEVDITISVDQGATCEISLYRPISDGGFDEAKMARLREVYPVLAACFRDHWRRHGAAYGCRSGGRDVWADDVLDQFGAAVLTNRERQVIQLVLRGHSSQSIGDLLEISMTTVKTHRKHAYEKLGISTQAELLSSFLGFVRSEPGFARVGAE
ncbi:MAG: helix-turn-helix transcriptional regulator [Pseudomonadota bacterium]